MVYEQLLTILFAVAIGAAIIVYAAKPRQRSIPASIAHVSAIESFSQANLVQAAPMPQVTAVEAPSVETAFVSEPQSVAEVAPVVADVAAAGATEAAPISSISGIDVSAVASAPAAESTGTTSHSSTRSHRATKRKSTTGHAKPRTRKSKA
jgi:hypothetical protein